MLEEYLKDRFVAGLASGRIKDRVSEEEHTVKLKEIIDIALKKEAALTIATAPAELNKLEIQGRRKAGSEQQKKQARVADTVRDPKKKCNACGEADHNFFTWECPSKRMFSRKIKTRLDLMTREEADKQRDRQIRHFKGNREISFQVGESVYVKDYRNVNKTVWAKAEIYKIKGPRTYLCRIMGSQELIWKRHADQIIRVGQFYGGTFDEIDSGRDMPTRLFGLDSFMVEHSTKLIVIQK
ncbi:hypothetical protein QE152_g19184 [Popillia japonica]|uniref:Uncharacterized protein n=1 Tax=Popillia japonica TaxID=7064 RepID=A0AAW1L495_POPJA